MAAHRTGAGTRHALGGHRLLGGHRVDRPLQLVGTAIGVAVVVAALVLSGMARGAQSASRSPTVTAQLAAGGCSWHAPVDGVVVDPFRQPSHRYGPGNRGLEYGVAEGSRVRAVAAGIVTFAGPVAGRRYVVVEHDRPPKSTYGPLGEVTVVRGQPVEQGADLGSASAAFHLTARIGDRYVDPQPLLDGRCGRARLVPVDAVT